MSKQFKVTVTCDHWHDDFVKMEFTVNAATDLDAIRQVNKAMKQLGISQYNLETNPIQYTHNEMCGHCFGLKYLCSCERTI